MKTKIVAALFVMALFAIGPATAQKGEVSCEELLGSNIRANMNACGSAGCTATFAAGTLSSTFTLTGQIGNQPIGTINQIIAFPFAAAGYSLQYGGAVNGHANTWASCI
ncbi:MAG: hypothetical protein ACPHK8_04290 [Thermoplasmatota archaeon]